MSLDIGSAFETGWEKLRTTAAVQLAALMAVAELLTSVGTGSFGTTSAFGTRPIARVGPGTGVLLLLVGIALSVVLTVVVFRTVTRDADALAELPAGVTDDLAGPAVALAVVWLLRGIATGVGLMLLVIPGVFIAVSLYFAGVYAVVEEEGPIDALSASWSLTKGNRLSVLGFAVVAFLLSVLASVVGLVVGMILPPLGSLVGYALSGFVTVLVSAALVDAYRQLGDGGATGGGSEHEPSTATATPDRDRADATGTGAAVDEGEDEEPAADAEASGTTEATDTGEPAAESESTAAPEPDADDAGETPADDEGEEPETDADQRSASASEPQSRTEELLAALDADDEATRETAAEELRELAADDPSALDGAALAAAFEDEPSASVRLRLVDVLAHLDSEPARDALRDARFDPDPEVSDRASDRLE